MTNLPDKLLLLKSREQELSYLKELSFSSEDEFKDYYDKNKSLFLELKSIKVEIRKIEWSLKSDIEKKEDRMATLKLIEKFKDENDDIDKILYLKDYINLIDTLDKILNNKFIDSNTKLKFSEFKNELQEFEFWGL